MKIVGDPVFYEPLAVGFDKSADPSSESLYEAVDAIVAEMHEDGTLTACRRSGTASTSRPSSEPQTAGAWERFQLASARIPFRLKVAAVWVVLFAAPRASSATRPASTCSGSATTSATSSAGCATR